jgi:hypothetical protein
MKSEFLNSKAHDLCTTPNRFKDFRGSFDKIKWTRSLGTKLLTFFSLVAIDFSISKYCNQRMKLKDGTL